MVSSSRHDHLPRHSGQRREAVISSRRSKTARYAWLSVLGVLMLVASALALTLRGGNLAASSSGSDAPMFGSSISSQGSLNSDTQEFGKMPIVRVYYPGLPSDNAWTTGRAEFNHSAVVVSFNASPASVLSGSDDSSLTHFFDTAPSGHAIYWSYIHEPEGHIKRGEFTVDQYKSAWAHVVSLANAAHNSDLHSTLILGSYVFSPHSGLLPWQDYLPGGNIISTLAWDAYPVGSAKNINPQLTPPSDFMAQCRRRVEERRAAVRVR